jgi:hypothetical protein
MKINLSEAVASRIPFIESTAKEDKALAVAKVNAKLKEKYGAMMAPAVLSRIMTAARKGEKIEVTVIAHGPKPVDSKKPASAKKRTKAKSHKHVKEMSTKTLPVTIFHPAIALVQKMCRANNAILEISPDGISAMRMPRCRPRRGRSMRRRRFPYLALFPDPALVPDGPKRDLVVWLRALAIRQGMLTYPNIIAAAVTDPNCPIHRQVVGDQASLIYKARKMVVTQHIRTLVFYPSVGPTRQPYRVLVSALVDNVRQLVPTPWLVRQEPMMREVLARARSFSSAWSRHEQNMLALQRLPTNQRYYHA